MREFAKEYRESLLRKITKQNTGNKPAKVLEAEKIIAKYRDKHKNLELQLSRLNSSDCPNSICPHCFYSFGFSHNLKPISGNDEIDKFECDECHYVYEEPA